MESLFQFEPRNCVLCGCLCQPAPTNRGWVHVDNEAFRGGVHCDCLYHWWDNVRASGEPDAVVDALQAEVERLRSALELSEGKLFDIETNMLKPAGYFIEDYGEFWAITCDHCGNCITDGHEGYCKNPTDAPPEMGQLGWERWAESCPVRRMESCYEDREEWYLCGDFGNTPCKPDKYCPTRAVRVQAEDRQHRAERERENAEYLARKQEAERQSQERLRRMVTRTRYRGKP
jgi:hypothetical protein